MSNKTQRLSVEKFLNMLRASARRHTQGLRHYTTMSSFMKMIHSGKFYLTLLKKSNDESEYESDRHYMMCFNYEKAENVALWSIYGVPRNDSIRLSFPWSDIMEWFNSVKDGELGFYGVDSRMRLVCLEDACPKVSICDVAYYGNGIFTHKDTNYVVKCDGQPVSDPNKDQRLAPYVKKWAWSFEQEVRVVFEFNKAVLDARGNPFRRIAVDFDEPLQALCEGNGEIRLSPWCRRSEKTVQKAGLSKTNVVKSDFKGLVKLRTPCLECDKETQRSCACKYKGMMK